MEFTKEQLIEKAKENVEFFRERLELLPQSQPMALSLRLAEITLASLEAELVAWRYRTTDINGNPRPGWSFSEEASLMGLYQPLYTAPPAPIMPDESIDPRDVFETIFPIPRHAERLGKGYACTEYSAWGAQHFISKWEGWFACHTAMLLCKDEQWSEPKDGEPRLHIKAAFKQGDDIV